MNIEQAKKASYQSLQYAQKDIAEALHNAVLIGDPIAIKKYSDQALIVVSEINQKNLERMVIQYALK